MSATPECLRCGGAMRPGLVLDHAHGGLFTTQNWVEAGAEKSFWFGVTTGGHEKFGVRTLRCEKCGYLESYATTKAE